VQIWKGNPNGETVQRPCKQNKKEGQIGKKKLLKAPIRGCLKPARSDQMRLGPGKPHFGPTPEGKVGNPPGPKRNRLGGGGCPTWWEKINPVFKGNKVGGYATPTGLKTAGKQHEVKRPWFWYHSINPKGWTFQCKRCKIPRRTKGCK